MNSIQDIYEAIATDGFSERVLQLIDEQVNDIENGRANFSRFNREEALQQVAMLKAAKEAQQTGR